MRFALSPWHRPLLLALCLLGLPLAAQAEDLLSIQMVDEARMWQSKGRMDLAADTWRRLLITNPQHGEALVGLAKIQLQAGHLQDAQALLARAARLPKKPSTYPQVLAALQTAKARAEAPPPKPSAPLPVSAAPVAAATPAPNARLPQAAPTTTPSAKAAPTQPRKSAAPAPSATPAPPPPPTKLSATAHKPAAMPVPPPPTEVQVTPIPFRSVQAREPAEPLDDDKRPESVQLRGSSELLQGARAPSAAPSAAPTPPSRAPDTPTKSPSKNKPRPYRPAPALSPPLSE